MTYQQSLKNIETLKNLILPLEGHQVFFDFSNQTDFKMLFFKNSESDEISKLFKIKYGSKMPAAHIMIDPQGFESFYYGDSFIQYEYNLTADKIEMHDSKEPFRNSTPAEIAIQFHKLLLKLKNM